MVALASVLAAGPAAAERLIASLTNHRVMITSSYTGVELVLFGSVERDPASVERKGPYDVVATITGPREPLRTNVDHTPWRSLSGTFRFAALSSEPKCNTPADLIIGTVDQDLRECCHAMLFAFVG
jgi:hypothetical protein